MNNHQICGIVTGPTVSEAIEQINGVKHLVDCIELRIDYLENLNVKEIVSSTNLPVIMALRSHSHGGQFHGSAAEQREMIEELAKCSPVILDIESHLDSKWIQKLKKQYPHIKILRSHHDLFGSPQNLNLLIEDMKTPAVDVYKIVTHANDSLDGMRMLKFIRNCPENIIGFCMGDEGVFTRLLAPIMGSQLTYGPTAAPTAPGQISLSDLLEKFRIQTYSEKTDILGLIGNPVNKSKSIETHQRALHRLNIDGVYVQIRVTKENINEFLAMASELNFLGLSVTMPNKEIAAKMIRSPETAVNTLKFQGYKIEGLNTDGIGALRAIGHSKNKKMVILGAGGAAYGIAREAIRQNTEVVILNRTPARAEKLAETLHCEWNALDNFPEEAEKGYDILVNTIPSAECPVDEDFLLSNRVCLEVITKEKETPFTHAARNKGCHVVPGFDMFIEQAKEQYFWWYENQPNIDEVFNEISEEVSCKN